VKLRLKYSLLLKYILDFVQPLLMLSQSELTPSDEPSQQVVLAKCVSCSQLITKEDEIYLCHGPQSGKSKKRIYLHGGEEGGGCGSYFEFEVVSRDYVNYVFII